MKKIFTILVTSLMLTACSHSNNYGVCVFRDGKTNGINMNISFPMHSVMKFPLALYVADCMNQNSVALEDSMLVKKADLMPNTWSPMLKMFEDERYFSYAELLTLSLQQSDNNACELLFQRFGSPSLVEAFILHLGFPHIHIRWTEREMAADQSLSKDNNCTPCEMAKLFHWFYENRDHDDYLRFLWQTMAACQTGKERLPSAFPNEAICVHKTGTGFPFQDGTMDRNDTGIVILPNGTAIMIAVFVPHAKDESDVSSIAKEFL